MLQEDIKSLCSHVVENFSKELETIDYVQTFKALKMRYEQHQDKLKDRERATLDRYKKRYLFLLKIFIDIILFYFYFTQCTVDIAKQPVQARPAAARRGGGDVVQRGGGL